jgi:hypothetical protein
MPTIANLRNTIDTFLTNHWPTIVARQETYKSNHGKYWQGLRTHTFRPSYTNTTGAAATPDNFSAKPTDGNQTWADVMPEWASTGLPATFRIDVYKTPAGEDGWVATVEVMHNGTLYSRSKNVGPETHRDKAWHAVVEPEII